MKNTPEGNTDWDAHAQELEDSYCGPEEIGWVHFPGGGTTYYADFDSFDIQIYVTERKRKIRIFINGKEYTP